MMLCILCAALIAYIALFVVTGNHNAMFARVLTPATVMLSCMSPSQRIEEDKIALLQPDQRQECCQLLDEFADQFVDRPGRCDAVVYQAQTTHGPVQRQIRPCRAPDVCSESRPMRSSNGPMTSPTVFAAKMVGGVSIASDCGYLNSVSVGDAYLMPIIDEVLYGIAVPLPRHIMSSATTLTPICCHVNDDGNLCGDRTVNCVYYVQHNVRIYVLHIYVLHCNIDYLMISVSTGYTHVM